MKKLFAIVSLGLAIGAFGLVLRPARAQGFEPTGTCCCVVQDGHLVCTITGEVLEECCCK